MLWPDDSLLGAPAPRSRALQLAVRGRSITVQAPEGREILIAVQGAPAGTAVIRTFVTTAQLRAGVVRAWLILGLLGMGLLAVGLAVADGIARSMLGPVTALAGLPQRLSGGDLDARIRPAGPAETRDVGAALNHLAGRIDDLLAGEREAAAGLSHGCAPPDRMRLKPNRFGTRPRPNASWANEILKAASNVTSATGRPLPATRQP
ncbi:MAG: HAMP domain-containing protein [Actinoallomurus sp.]